MPISISTNFFPYRLSLARKKPMELKVDIVNRGEKSAMITLQVLLSRQLALDKSGLKSNDFKRIERFPPNERKQFVFDIFPKGYVGVGTYPIEVKVLEHYNQYKYVEREYTKKLQVTVEE